MKRRGRAPAEQIVEEHEYDDGTPEMRRAANVAAWAALLVAEREIRKRDLQIAKLRDLYEEVTGGKATDTVPLEIKGARRGDRVQFLPMCSTLVEKARTDGKLRANGYVDHGALEPVTWRWMRAIHEYILGEEDLEAVAEAYALADGNAWPPRPWTAQKATWVRSQLEAVRVLYGRATRSLKTKAPLVPSRRRRTTKP